AKVADSNASGNVTAGPNSLAGGIAGSGNGSFTNVSTSSAQTVKAGNDSVLGGLVAVIELGGSVSNSASHGAVSGPGAKSVVGGVVGVNAGNVSGTTASGTVTAANSSYAGGLIGINFGSVQSSSTTSTASVTGTGQSVIGGLVGANGGTVDHSNAAGAVTGTGQSHIIGGLGRAHPPGAHLPPPVRPPRSA